MANGAPISSHDLRSEARARMPRFAFDYVDGGAGAEDGLKRSLNAWRETCLDPRVLINSDGPADMKRRFLRQDWALPFGIAPLGLPGLAWPGADIAMAGAAEAAGAPFVTSTPATAALETVRAAAPTASWFQLYVGADPRITEDLMNRAAAAGMDTMVVTADVPRPGKRLRDLRNGFALPFRYTPRLLADLAGHPAWSLATLSHGAPRFANLERYAEAGAGTQSLARLMAGQSSGRLDWELFGRIRERWAGQLVLKGVLHPRDAVRAVEAGADAVQVSAHGGRQLDGSPAPLRVLPAIRAALPPGFPLAIDGGVRSGEDVLKALIAGADFVFLGRSFLYALGAMGSDGPAALFQMLGAELESAMAQTGRRDLSGLHAADNGSRDVGHGS